MKHKVAKKRKIDQADPMVVRNQFFGMLVLAVGMGALIVVVRYFVISLQAPNNVYLIQLGDLIPGQMSR